MAVTTRKRAADPALTPRSSKRLKAALAKPSTDTPSTSAQTKKRRSARTSRRASVSPPKSAKAKPAPLTPEEREKAALVAALSAARTQYVEEQKTLTEGEPVRDGEFYLGDPCAFKEQGARKVNVKEVDMFVFLAQKTLFRLPRPVLVKHANLFADMFEVPQPMDEDADGRSDDRPIILYDMNAESFRWFIRYILGKGIAEPVRPLEYLYILVFAHRAGAHLAYERACECLYRTQTIRRPLWACKHSREYDHYLEDFDWQDLMARELAIELLDTALDLGLEVSFFPGALASLVFDKHPLTAEEKALFMRRDSPSLDDNAFSINADDEREEALDESVDIDSDDGSDKAAAKDIGKGAELVHNTERARTMWAYCTRIAGEGVRERGRLGVVIRTVWVPPNRHCSGWEVLNVRS